MSDYPSSKRFNIVAHGAGMLTIRDRNAPHHCHALHASELPPIGTLAYITEAQFDAEVSNAIYNK